MPTTDCFGNPTPGIPGSISDTYADIQVYAVVPLAMRLDYHYARIDALMGRESPERAWNLLAEMDRMRT
jgi:hypothetical protein